MWTRFGFGCTNVFSVRKVVRLEEDPRCYGSPAQRTLLKVIGGTPLWRAFFLTGGTCLAAFYLHHRVSQDLDFFTVEDIDLRELVADTRAMLRPEQIVAVGEHFFSCVVEGIKLDFVADRFSGPGPRPAVTLDEVAVSIDRLDNLRPNKICALISRGAAKDAVDCYFLYRDAPETFEDDYAVASQREALLDDLLYAGERLLCVAEETPEILRRLAPDLRVSVPMEEMAEFFRRLGGELFRRGQAR